MSKFTSAIHAAKGLREASLAAETSKNKTSPTERPSSTPQGSSRPGRPTGKRSNGNTVQVTAYIEASTHMETKIRLLQIAQNQGEKQDFSDLVQQLLREWLKRQK